MPNALPKLRVSIKFYVDQGRRHVAHLNTVPENIRHEFQLLWFEAKWLASKCDDKQIVL